MYQRIGRLSADAVMIKNYFVIPHHPLETAWFQGDARFTGETRELAKRLQCPIDLGLHTPAARVERYLATLVQCPLSKSTICGILD
jgi:hypothetical protein